MANDVKLQEGHPVDENLRPIKVGGKATAIEVAKQGNGAKIVGDLHVEDDITCDDITCDVLTATTISNFASTNLTIDDSGDITLDADGGNITLQDGGSAYTPTVDSDAATKRYVDSHINQCISIPVYFDGLTDDRTWLRNSDDLVNPWEWDAYDSEADTTVGNTIAIRFGEAVSGFLVPFDCNIASYKWAMYQSQNVSGDIHAQIWTGTPSANVTITLRATDNLTGNRAFASAGTSLDVALSAGDMIYIGFQNVTETAGKWTGSVSLLLEET